MTVTGSEWVAQTFTAGISGNLDQVDLFLVRVGSPGDLTVQIQSVLGGVPSGNVLALCDEGLLDFRRGPGVTVAGSPEHGAAVVRAKELVRFARQHGYRLEELVRIIEDVG